ncbi:MAG: hypothetical protein PHW66_09685 [Gallionella sp.]|nr:hypothetical protein [Gallionella sp.]
MNFLLGLFTKNPMVILWVMLAAFIAGGVSGGGAAWTVQGWRLDAVQAKFDGFVATAKAEGEAAQTLKAAQEKKDKLNKEQTDAETKLSLDTLRADNKRLRNESRARGNFVPSTASNPSDITRACFDRPQLESAIQRLDSGVSGLVDKGSEAVVKLNAAKVWALRMSDTLTPRK